MQYSVGQTGRVVVMRLEDGEPIYSCIEAVAAKEGLKHAAVWVIGGIGKGGVVVGPEHPGTRPVKPMVRTFNDAREILGVGLLAPDPAGVSRLHLHAAMGRGDQSIVGCPRVAAECWLVDEVILVELKGISAARLKDSATGFELLQCGVS